MAVFLTIFAGTFLLEDVALASSLALVANGKMSMMTAFLACFLGIGIGDLGLYFLGYGTSLSNRIREHKFFKKYEATFSRLENSNVLPYSIVISRILPGTRIPTYVGAGFLRYPFWRFFSLTSISVFLWVLVALFAGQSLNHVLQKNWILSLLILLTLLMLFKYLASNLIDPWKRKAFFHSWRKWQHFEFWPAWVFYLPIVPYYFYLSLKARSFLLPFYANPQILNGGLIGESKFDFLKHLKKDDPTTLKCLLLDSTSADFIQSVIEQNQFSYPFIIKPDIGQRGYGVRIIRSQDDLESYLHNNQSSSLIVQELSHHPREAGIFYYRHPSQEFGSIFSITDKKFPELVADGQKNLGDLILSDLRARMIAPVYFSRHREQLNKVFTEGSKIQLSECGNHCQGAIFENGEYLMSDALAKRIDSLAKSIPDFYIGRFDVKYRNEHLLTKGLEFQIVEVNGAGSEATHIWDSKTKLSEAYSVLFKQWKILFEIGNEIKLQKRTQYNLKIWAFLKECFSVVRRNDKLSISS